MDLVTDLESLDNLINRLRAYVTVDAKAEWTAAQATLDRLIAEAKELGAPWGRVSQYAGRLRHHLGILLGAKTDDGNPREQHLAWAIGDMQSMRAFDAFGPALDRLKEGPSGALH